MSHNHNHNYKHEAPKTLSHLIISIVINIGIVIFEIILGILSNSLALISDAFHNITDIFSMILGYVSEKLMSKGVDDKKTYGYKKIEFIAAFVNSLILLVATVYIFYEGVMRLFHPVEVVSLQMFYVGIVAVFGNGIATWILSKSSKENTNMKAVWLHSLQDTVLSLGVIFGAVIIYFTGFNIVDPIISIFISIFLLRSIYFLLKETFAALIDSVPENIEFEEIRNDLIGIEGVGKVSDLHIWLANSHTPMLSVHLQIDSKDILEDVFTEAKKILSETYKIEHCTIQIIPKSMNANLKCVHCN